MSEPFPVADELGVVFARMSGLLLSEETVATALRLITSLAVQTISTATGAGVTLVDQHGRRSSAAASNDLVERADALQYELDEGPCLAAYASRTAVRVDDVRSDHRWPRWASQARRLDLRSSLSVPLVAGDRTLGAVKVYAREPAAFDGGSEQLMTLFSAQAAILLANVQSYQAAQQLTENLRVALGNRDVIGQAKGLLMGRDGIDEHTAFARLLETSNRENVKVAEVARALVHAHNRRLR